MKKYYLLAIDKDADNNNTIKNLEIYYDGSNLLIEKLEFFVKYIDKIGRKKVIKTINNVGNNQLSKEDKKKFINIIMDFEFKDNDKISTAIDILIETLNYKISITKLHFEYSLEGKGFEEAKNDFYDKII